MYLLIVTGMSGAGKSTALKALEELGYYCVDNLPSPMLPAFVEMCNQAKPPIERAAVAVDSRESLLSAGPEDAVDMLMKLTCRYEILFLDARDEVLMERYNETRRRHPLGEGGDVASGVRLERSFLGNMLAHADYVLDTSDVAVRNVPKMMRKILPEIGSPHMSLVICSFGYKRGVPVDADIVLDMRFAENPYYVPELRKLSGLDQPVKSFLEDKPLMDDVLNWAVKLVKDTMPYFEIQGKNLLRLCFGCTGGRHRSVYAAETVAQRLREDGIPVRVYHRDLTAEAADIESRMMH
ncbi:MAG: RNase adapter RapZ [Clostridia bacterium]|nr:RNase adapter RapZ [Clostridia bacterium]